MTADLVALVHMEPSTGFNVEIVPVDIAHQRIIDIYQQALHPVVLRGEIRRFVTREIAKIESGQTLALEIDNSVSMMWSHAAIYRHPGETFDGDCVCISINPIGDVRRFAFAEYRDYVKSRIEKAWGLA